MSVASVQARGEFARCQLAGEHATCESPAAAARPAHPRPAEGEAEFGECHGQ